MKNVKLLLSALVASTLMFSCSSDDGGGSSTGGNIEARWNPTRTIVEVNGDVAENEAYDQNEPNCEKDYVEFADANVVNFVAYVQGGSGNCEASPGTPGTWAKSDNTLTISDFSVNGQSFSGTYVITRLTGSELRIKQDFVAGGITTTYKIYFTKATNQVD